MDTSPDRGSNPPSPKNGMQIQDPTFRKHFEKSIEGRKIVGTSQFPISSTHNGFPHVHIHPGREHHHVASFYMDKPINRQDEAHDSNTFQTEFSDGLTNHEIGKQIFQNTANFYNEFGYRYTKQNLQRTGSNPNAHHEKPEVWITNRGERADGYLLNVLTKSRSPSPEHQRLPNRVHSFGGGSSIGTSGSADSLAGNGSTSSGKSPMHD